MILLDTHALLWWLTDPGKLSTKVDSAIRQELSRSSMLVSTISIWELSLLSLKKRIKLSDPLEQWLQHLSQMKELSFVPLDNEIAYQSTILPGIFHSDPSDRFIVATAIINKATLITKDLKIRRYKYVKTLW